MKSIEPFMMFDLPETPIEPFIFHSLSDLDKAWIMAWRLTAQYDDFSLNFRIGNACDEIQYLDMTIATLTRQKQD